jgi:glucose/mannose transport system substrate-binding protein
MDAQRVGVLRDALASTGSTWKDFTLARGWSGRAESLLRQRVQSHNPPSVAMMKTPIMQQWATAGMLLPLDDVAAAQHWDDLLPGPIADSVKYMGRYYAVPLNVHRVNWLWINARILKESGAVVPTTWDEFFVAAEAMKRAGYAAVAYHGSEAENLLMFEIIALGVGGPRFYRKALIDYEPAELSGTVMETVLRTYRKVKNYAENSTDPKVSFERSGTRFQLGQVGMHLMGDWRNPAFYPADKSVPFKYLCVAAPQTDGVFLFTSDSLAMFRSADVATSRAQQAFARSLMSQPVQHDYNVRKGSIPARRGVDLDGYESCALKTASTFHDAVKTNALLPEISMTAQRPVQEAIKEIVFEFWQDDRLSPRQVMSRLVAATRQR